MKLETFAVDKSNAQQEQTPFVRINLLGGCGLAGCGCSPEPYISISDGTRVHALTLTKAQAKKLMTTGALDFEEDNMVIAAS